MLYPKSFFISAVAIALPALLSTATAETRPATVYITRSASTPRVLNVEVRAENWDSRTELQRKLVTWTEWRCDYDPGRDGQPTWFDDYLNLPKSMKANQLTKAIAGITREQAQIIVNEGGYFVSRPATWNSFKQEIWNIEVNLGNPYSTMRGLYWNTIILHGNENYNGMGYAPRSGGRRGARGDGDYNDDGPAPIPAPIPEPVPAPIPPPNNSQNPSCELVERSDTIWTYVDRSFKTGDLTKAIDLYFSGSQFLRGEKETIALTWDGRSSRVEIDTSKAAHLYSLSIDARRNRYSLVARARNKISAPDADDFNATIANNPWGRPVLKIRDSRATYLRNKFANYQLTAFFHLVVRTANGFETTHSNEPISSSDGSIEVDLTPYLNEISEGQIEITGLKLVRESTPLFFGSVDYNKPLSIQARAR